MFTLRLYVSHPTAPGDYGAIVDMVITFPAGTTSVTFPVPTFADFTVEGTEMFGGILSNPTGGAVLGTFTATIDVMESIGKSFELGLVLL